MPKASLKRRKKNPRSRYWKTKCWALCRKMWADKCAVCGKVGKINLHHLLDKRAYGECYFDQANLIGLCPQHHKFGRFSFHTNPLWAIEWLKEHEPLRIAYMEMMMKSPKVPLKKRPTHKETYEELLKLRDRRT